MYSTLANLRLHAAIPSSGQDDLLTLLLEAATERIDRETNSTFETGGATATDEVYSGNGGRNLRLRRRPVLSVSSVKIDDTAISDSLYHLNELGFLVAVESVGANSFNPRVWRGDDAQQFVWPRGTGNIKVTYAYGYTTMPSSIQLACEAIAVAWYLEDQRRGIISESMGPRSYSIDATARAVPPSVMAMLSGYRQIEVGI